MRDMNMFRCGDMMVRNVAHVDKFLFPLVGQTFDQATVLVKVISPPTDSPLD
jgi:hypothetical protein